MPLHLTADDPVDNRLFVQTQSGGKLITNTASETSALGSGIGSRMVAPNQLKVGNRIMIRGRGVYSTPTLGLGVSIAIRVKMNSTVVAQVTTTSVTLGVANMAFKFECEVVVNAVGAAGKVVCGGEGSYTIVPGSKAFDDLDNAGVETTVDTTVAQMLDVTLQWDAASTTRSLRTTLATITLI